VLGWLELGRELCWGQGLGLEFLAFTVSRACSGVVFGGKWGIAPVFRSCRPEQVESLHMGWK